MDPFPTPRPPVPPASEEAATATAPTQSVDTGFSPPRVTRIVWRGWPRALRDGGFLLAVALLVAGSIAALRQVAYMLAGPAQTSNLAVTGGRVAQCARSLVPAGTSTRQARVVAEQVCVLPIGDPTSSLMQPVMDARGNLWFGEMRTDRLVRYDPRTGQVEGWVVPQGRQGLMTIRLDAQGSIWFSEDEAGYVGRFDPDSQRFDTYPVPPVNGHSAQPEDIQFGPDGAVWFAAVQGGYIGRLDPATGEMRTWPVATTRPDGKIARPYSLALAKDGSVWFGMALYGGSVGRLDPSTGQVTFHPLADSSANVVAMAPDRAGIIWFAELEENRLGRIDPRAQTVSELPIPEPLGDTSGLAALTIASDGAVWLGSIRANALVRYQPRTDSYTFFPLTVPGSAPTGLLLTPEGIVWFVSNGERPGTTEHEPADYIGWLAPAITDD